MKNRTMLAPLAFFAVACQPVEAEPSPPPESLTELAGRIETASAGRLGVALVSRDGELVAGSRADERFAMCSTFKLLLAGMVLDGSRRGEWRLDDEMPVTQADLVPHSPLVEQHVKDGAVTMREAAQAAVTLSDNAAANLLLEKTGGLAAFNRWLASHGDTITRLDRMEPALNENRPGDPRDTTTPARIARDAAGLVFGDWLHSGDRRLLREWLVSTTTGLERLRAGLPEGWTAGDKTGTCGGAHPSFNDVAFVLPDPAEDEQGFVLAVYLDRPQIEPDAANVQLAEVARTAALLMERR